MSSLIQSDISCIYLNRLWRQTIFFSNNLNHCRRVMETPKVPALITTTILMRTRRRRNYLWMKWALMCHPSRSNIKNGLESCWMALTLWFTFFFQQKSWFTWYKAVEDIFKGTQWEIQQRNKSDKCRNWIFSLFC